MIGTTIRRIAGLALLLASGALFLWSMRPLPVQRETAPLYVDELGSIGSGIAAPGGERLKVGEITLEWPRRIRKGESGSVRLTMNLDSNPESQNALMELGLEMAVLQSRLELAGIRHTPTGEISQAFSLDHPVVFLWNLRADQTGDYPGRCWLHLLAKTKIESGRKLLVAPEIQVEVESLLGLGGEIGRALGAAGMAAGAILSLDGLANWLFRRLMKKG